jgi:hypothetical protein
MAIFSLASATGLVGHELGESEAKPAMVTVALALVVS